MSFKFSPPDAFDFANPGGWPEWRDRFARYRLAVKLKEEDGEVQVSALIYAMGGEAEHIYKAMVFADGDEKDDYDIVLKKFDAHFVPKRNIIHERAKFYQRVQNQGEGVESFIRSLYELAEHCNFEGHLKDEQIRDRIVIGLTDKQTSQRLQMKSELTLETAIQIARQAELVKSQVTAQGEVQNLQEVRSTCVQPATSKGQSGKKPGGKRGGQKNDSASRKQPSLSGCSRCGNNHQPGIKNCPAKGIQCHKCHFKGHFARYCRTKVVQVVTEQDEPTKEDEPVESYHLGMVTCSDGVEAVWREVLQTQGGPVDFKLDSGADVTIISDKTWKSMRPRPKLNSVQSKLTSPGGPLECVGQFIARTQVKNKLYHYRVFVTKNTNGGAIDNLLGRGVAVKMGLIRRVYEIQYADESIGVLDCKPADIFLKGAALPYSVSTTRRVPIPLLPKVEAELQRMEKNGIIEKASGPTEWCAPMVAVPKKSGQVRICVDLRQLNKSVIREKRQIPVLDDVIHKLAGSSVFSKLDAASGFWQIPLSKDSQKLTTFITPVGRFWFKRLPFGITSAPEVFQDRMEQLLTGLPGVVVIMDDILIHGADEAEHDERYNKVLEVLTKAGLKLNSSKCLLKKKKLVYMGNLLSENGLEPDPDKVSAVVNLKPPENITELRRFLGMTNYLARFIPNSSTLLKPLNDLLKTQNMWMWGESQDEAFNKIKSLITSADVLTFYDPNKPTVVSADASSYGIGGVLLQQQRNGDLLPVAYASRTLTDAETRYAQVEKELLASVWICEKFSKHLIGLKEFILQTDHKPLISIINKQDLDKTPIRCQRLLMRLMRFNPTATYVPGKELAVADLLSRDPQKYRQDDDTLTDSDVKVYVDSVLYTKPMSSRRMTQIREETAIDQQLQTAMKFTKNGWPEHARNVPASVQDLFNMRTELSVIDDILVLGTRIVIPQQLRSDILERVHEGHLGVNKCKERALMSVWWPGISTDIERKVAECSFCQQNRPSQRKEPLLTTVMPNRAWQRIGVDLCEQAGTRYLIVVDYYSRYIEIAHLTNMTSAQTIGKLKNMFAHWGIPDEVFSDNGTQFTSEEFRNFAHSYGFCHTTSSPHFPQSNGAVERAVQTAKKILKQPDPFLGLMAYRSSPVSPTGRSPCQLIMGRNIQTRLPTLESNLQPQVIDNRAVKVKDKQTKETYRSNYNRRYGVRPLPELQPGDHVLVKLDGQKDWSTPAVITRHHTAPRSYIVQTPDGSFRRNRRHLQYVPKTVPTSVHVPRSSPLFSEDTDIPNTVPEDTPGSTDPSPPATPAVRPNVSPTSALKPYITKSGRTVVKPVRFRD